MSEFLIEAQPSAQQESMKMDSAKGQASMPNRFGRFDRSDTIEKVDELSEILEI